MAADKDALLCGTDCSDAWRKHSISNKHNSLVANGQPRFTAEINTTRMQSSAYTHMHLIDGGSAAVLLYQLATPGVCPFNASSAGCTQTSGTSSLWAMKLRLEGGEGHQTTNTRVRGKFDDDAPTRQFGIFMGLQCTSLARVTGACLLLPSRDGRHLADGMFLHGLSDYGPPVDSGVYHRVAAAARRLHPAPLYVSVCADHNDTSGGAEHRRPHGDPGDGGRITPICDLQDSEGTAVRAGLAVLREAGVKILHYTHTRLSNWPVRAAALLRFSQT